MGRRRDPAADRDHLQAVTGEASSDPPPAPTELEPDPALLRAARARLRDPGPWPLLGLASALLASLDAATHDPFARTTARPLPAGAVGQDVLRALVAVDTPATTGLLAAVAALTPDELAARRLHRELAGRAHELPDWLDDLDEIAVPRAVRLAGPDGGGGNLALQAHVAGGRAATLVVHLGDGRTAPVRDAFLLEGDVESVVARLEEVAPADAEVIVGELGRAEARRSLADALLAAADVPVRTETWPASRPLLARLTRELPGEAIVPDDAAAADGPAASRLGHPAGSDASSGPRALARLVGAETGHGWEGLLREGCQDVDERAVLLELLREAVGGEAALRDLDARPLPPAEDLDLDDVSAPVRPRVRTVAQLTDAAATELLDAEHATACRRLLADVAAVAPSLVRRGRPETLAAAVAWIVARANDTLDPRRGPSARQLTDWFGVSSVHRRAAAVLHALDVAPSRRAGGDLRLGTTRYLVAARRAALREHRDRLLARGR